ncbi:MAG: heme A synthase [Anaerolineae bacterium]
MTASTLERHANVRARALYPTLAVAALISTILLVMVGSIVRVTGNGLGCPDWPLCHGQAIPPALTGAWVEFSHRLFGAFASSQIAFLAMLAWRRYRRRAWVFRPALAAVGLLSVQVTLGGLHVIYELPRTTGLIHTGLAMLIVGLLAVQVAVSLPPARRLSRRAIQVFDGSRFSSWVGLTAAATYGLLLTGSYVTRTGASLVCPAFPHCGPAGAGLRALVDIQMLHRFTAFGVALLSLVAVVWMLRRVGGGDRGLSRVAYGLAGLLLLQFALGISNVLLLLPMWSRVLHLTVGTAFWASLVIVWVIVAVPRAYANQQGGQRPS